MQFMQLCLGLCSTGSCQSDFVALLSRNTVCYLFVILQTKKYDNDDDDDDCDDDLQ